jgi:hypothetical protein
MSENKKETPKQKDYEFELRVAPPPKEYNNPDQYLFGFSEDYTPYIMRWEKSGGYWCAITLADGWGLRPTTASPKYLSPKEIGKRIKWWSEAPLTKDKIAST